MNLDLENPLKKILSCFIKNNYVFIDLYKKKKNSQLNFPPFINDCIYVYVPTINRFCVRITRALLYIYIYMR